MSQSQSNALRTRGSQDDAQRETKRGHRRNEMSGGRRCLVFLTLSDERQGSRVMSSGSRVRRHGSPLECLNSKTTGQKPRFTDRSSGSSINCQWPRSNGHQCSSTCVLLNVGLPMFITSHSWPCNGHHWLPLAIAQCDIRPTCSRRMLVAP